MKARILVVEDEERWLENFQEWIPEDLASQDSASSSIEAARLLRRFHYDLVLLDLSMDVTNISNRDTRPIQEYLARRPEGTLYIVISATAQKHDVRDAAFRLGAWDVIFKTEAEPAVLRERVAAAVADTGRHHEQWIIEARTKLIKDHVHDGQILSALQPRGGASSMYGLMDALFRAIAPIGQHRDRLHFAVTGQCVCGLVWSRLRGAAVSFVLANRSIEEEAALAELADWMGFAERGERLISRELHRVRIWGFEETSITDSHFDLPDIRVA